MRFMKTSVQLRVQSTADNYRLRWWITLTVMLVAVIEVLDMTIVNVALPDMMGSLGASVDQITWVLTSYIVSAAIVMPLTGLLVTRFGQRKLLLVNIIGFMVSSMLCGFSQNLIMMIVFRIAQGVFGAALVPLSQFILRDVFPKQEQGVAMALWGMGIMCAPVLGPALGGYITDHLTWRWVFYINLPICIVAYFLTLALIRETETFKNPLDGWGLTFMIVGVGALQLFLDRGNTVDWYEAASTTWLTLLFCGCLTLFCWRCLTVATPIINLQLFKDRNFAVSAGLMLVFVMMIFGQITLAPLMLQTLFNYPPAAAGVLMAPRGLGSMVAMAVVGRFMHRYDPRLFLYLGVLIAALGTFLLSRFSLSLSVPDYVLMSTLQGIGMGLFFVPLATLSLSTLPTEHIAEGAGLFSFARSLGTSLGISLMVTLLSRSEQVNWNTLAAYVNPYNPDLQLWLQATGWRLSDPQTLQHLAQVVKTQANMIAFNNIAWFATLCLLAITPLLLLLKKPANLVVSNDLH